MPPCPPTWRLSSAQLASAILASLDSGLDVMPPPDGPPIADLQAQSCGDDRCHGAAPAVCRRSPFGEEAPVGERRGGGAQQSPPDPRTIRALDRQDSAALPPTSPRGLAPRRHPGSDTGVCKHLEASAEVLGFKHQCCRARGSAPMSIDCLPRRQCRRLPLGERKGSIHSPAHSKASSVVTNFPRASRGTPVSPCHCLARGSAHSLRVAELRRYASAASEPAQCICELVLGHPNVHIVEVHVGGSDQHSHLLGDVVGDRGLAET